MASPIVHPFTSLTPQLLAVQKEGTDKRLQNVIGVLITSRYASSSPYLADFRSTTRDKDVKEDSTVLSDFRNLVPLTDYEAYRPWMAKFIERPCELSEVENLLAPGLPSFLAITGSTSGREPKYFTRYLAFAGLIRPAQDKVPSAFLTARTASTLWWGCIDLVEVTTPSGDVVKTIPVTGVTSGFARTMQGWSIETDNTRMTSLVPYQTSPWATGLIDHHRSFLLIHALFALADPTVERILAGYLTFFMDMVYYIQEEWDMLLSSIRDGIIPDIDHIDHVRDSLQVNMRADPQRADELASIGPPFSSPAWAPRIWPKLNTLLSVCSGTFAAPLPKARSVIGPNVLITSPGYGCTECVLGVPLNREDVDVFVVNCTDVVEYVEVADKQARENILQAWDVQPGKLYQPVVTTSNGLWRYVIDDVLHVIGFDPRNGSPVFTYHGRKNLVIELPHASIMEAELLKMIHAINGEDMVQVQEFTSVLDRRELPETVGLILEITDDIGTEASSARQKAFEALVSTNDEHQRAFVGGRLRLPTIRIVKSGTFRDYRQHRGEQLKTPVGQTKVPVVVMDPDVLVWLEERVVKEL